MTEKPAELWQIVDFWVKTEMPDMRIRITEEVHFQDVTDRFRLIHCGCGTRGDWVLGVVTDTYLNISGDQLLASDPHFFAKLRLELIRHPQYHIISFYESGEPWKSQ